MEIQTLKFIREIESIQERISLVANDDQMFGAWTEAEEMAILHSEIDTALKRVRDRILKL